MRDGEAVDSSSCVNKVSGTEPSSVPLSWTPLFTSAMNSVPLGGDPHQLQPALPHIVGLKCPLIRPPQCPAEDRGGFRLFPVGPQLTHTHTLSLMDEVFAALMKKVYLGEEFLSSLSTVLKRPNKGVDIISNTLPFPGHISTDLEVMQQQNLSQKNTHGSQNSPDKP